MYKSNKIDVILEIKKNNILTKLSLVFFALIIRATITLHKLDYQLSESESENRVNPKPKKDNASRSINKVILQIIRTLRHLVILGIEKDYLVNQQLAQF